MLVESEAVPEMRKHLAKSEEYFQRQKSNYFDDLIKAEQQKKEVLFHIPLSVMITPPIRLLRSRGYWDYFVVFSNYLLNLS